MEDFNGEYFHEHTRCPPVGIYTCKGNETNFETNVSKLWKRIEKAWNVNTLVKINWAFLNKKYKSLQDIRDLKQSGWQR